MAAGTTYPLSLSDLKAFTPGVNPNDIYYLTDRGKEGEFYLEATYMVTPPAADDAITVNSNNISGTYYRYRRIIDDGTISVKWFGAAGDGSTDDITSIQAAVDTAIASDGDLPTVYFPPGNYKINDPIICRASTPNTACYINLLGDFNFATTTGTTITANFTQTFAIGIQVGKGCSIKNLKITGLFDPDFSTYDFYNTPLEDYTDGVCRTSPNSPYAGIVIDPFTNGHLPPDGGYPDLSAQYSGDGSVGGGSTGCLIEQVLVQGFVVGLCFAPNASVIEIEDEPTQIGTRNCELMKVHLFQAANCQVGISNSHDQEKTNVLEHLMFWDNVHTCFAEGVYGLQLPGQYKITDVCIAGTVHQFIYHPKPDYFNIEVHNIYGEGLGRFGVLNSIISSSVTGGDITFVSFEACASMPDTYISAAGIKFTNVHFHFAGNELYPFTITGPDNVFDHCTFPAVPYIGNEEDFSTTPNTRFVDCTISQYNDQPFGWTHTMQRTNLTPLYSYGTGSVTDYITVRNGEKKTVTFENDLPTFLTGGTEQFTSLTVSDNELVITPADVFNYNVGELVLYNSTASALNVAPFGIITANDGTDVTISHIVNTLTTVTSAYFFVVHPIKFVCSFMGDVPSANSDTINNIIPAWGNPSDLLGEYIRVFNIGDNYSSWVKVLTYSPGTITHSGGIHNAGTALPFNIQGKFKIVLSGVAGVLDASSSYLTGTEIVDQLGNVNKIIKSGVTPASADTRKFTYTSLNTNGVHYLGFETWIGETDTVTDRVMIAAYNITNNAGVIQGSQNNVGFNIPVALQPLGANVLVGTFTDNGEKLQVAGTVAITGAITNGNLAGTGTRMVTASSTGVLSTIPASEVIDSFSLATDGSRTVNTGELTEYILLKSASTITGLIVGTTNSGSEIATINLAANQTAVINYNQFADTSFSIYFGNISSTVAIKIIKKMLV